MNKTEEFAKLFKDDQGRQILVIKSLNGQYIDYETCATVGGHTGRISFSTKSPNQQIRDVLFDNMKRKDAVDLIEKNIRSQDG